MAHSTTLAVNQEIALWTENGVLTIALQTRVVVRPKVLASRIRFVNYNGDTDAETRRRCLG